MKELEKNYLDKNSTYNIENILLSSMTNQEIKEFIWDLYNEYKSIEDKQKSKILKDIKNYSNLSELDKYFIIQTNQIFTYEWQRLIELESMLNRFDTRVLRNNYKDSWIKTSYIKIDVNDIPIIDVIARYINLPNNIRRNIKCPLHGDKTASFKVYINTNSYYCFWCKSWWNAINFIAEIENVNNVEAFKIFKNLYFN